MTPFEKSIKSWGITGSETVKSMSKVERDKFVPDHLVEHAYDNNPLPIGHGQTISQPYIVGKMTEVLDLKADDIVLEIGTGSGYQAAVLSTLCKTVYSIEIIKELGEIASKRLLVLNYHNVITKIGNGYHGWPEHAPFDKIIVTAAPDEIPHELVRQLKVGGKMVIPVGVGHQDLKLIVKTKTGIDQQSLLPVMFVPMTGKKKDVSLI